MAPLGTRVATGFEHSPNRDLSRTTGGAWDMGPPRNAMRPGTPEIRKERC